MNNTASKMEVSHMDLFYGDYQARRCMIFPLYLKNIKLPR